MSSVGLSELLGRCHGVQLCNISGGSRLDSAVHFLVLVTWQSLVTVATELS